MPAAIVKESRIIITSAITPIPVKLAPRQVEKQLKGYAAVETLHLFIDKFESAFEGVSTVDDDCSSL